MGNQESADDSGPGLGLRVLCWNIDGLDGRDLKKRTQAVIDWVKRRSPHVVYLQEVVAQSLSMIHSQLGSTYSVHISPKVTFMYFPATLVTKKCPKISLDSEIGSYDFPKSTMGRHLLQLSVRVCGVPVTLYNTHLESLKDNSEERKEQLKTCFQFVDEQRSMFNRACILGGDLNARDHEVSDVGLPASTIDVWEVCGSNEEHRYTWDITANDNLLWRFPNKPQLRFDRLYLTVPMALTADNDGEGFVRPGSFELIGKDRIASCKRFPSDHWGIFATFDVSDAIEKLKH